MSVAKRKKSATKSTRSLKLSKQQTGVVGLLGIVFLVMAGLQLFRFNEFEVSLAIAGLNNQTAWAIAIILAELLAAVGFLYPRLSRPFRLSSAAAALLVAGFWFFHNLRLISEGLAGLLPNAGFVGNFFAQSPGWWTTIETTVLLIWVIYSLNLMRSSLSHRLK